MTLNQEELIERIAEKENLKVTTVREIFKSAEEIIFAYLSSATPTKNVVVKVFNGISLESKYVPERTLNTFEDIICEPRLRVKPKITRYYNKKINGKV